MKLEHFVALSDLNNQRTLEKCRLLVFYLSAGRSPREEEASVIIEIFDELHYSRPNLSRLKKEVSGSAGFIKGSSDRHFRLSAKSIKELESNYPQLNEKSEEVAWSETLLPSSIFEDTPTYIQKLAKQINASFEHNIFDGCAVIMRRLLEVLLVQSYENLGIEDSIKDTHGNYKMLDGISKDAVSNSKLSLSRTPKNSLTDFKLVGNFAAHKLMYTTRRGDIEKVAVNFRATVEELLYKSGHLT